MEVWTFNREPTFINRWDICSNRRNTFLKVKVWIPIGRIPFLIGEVSLTIVEETSFPIGKIPLSIVGHLQLPIGRIP
jgi:hypothetical protein